MNRHQSTITLRALEGTPLEDETAARMVAATANAIAERNGVRLLRLRVGIDHVTATIEGDRLTSIGFAAELRRLTNQWYEHKIGCSLWGEPPRDDDWDRYGLFTPPAQH